MATLNVMISQGEVCRCLRTKTMFYQVEQPQPGEAAEAGPFWCTRTASVQGPDGQIADLNGCRPTRACCETV